MSLLNVRSPEDTAPAATEAPSPRFFGQGMLPSSPVSQEALAGGSLGTALSFASGMDDLQAEARSVELALQSNVSADFAREFPQLVSRREQAKYLDVDALEREAATTAQVLRQGGLIFAGADHVRDLARMEKSLRLLNTRKPGEAMAQEQFGAWDATLGALYKGLKDVTGGFSALSHDAMMQMQAGLRGADLDAAPLDEEMRENLKALAAADLSHPVESILPEPAWLKTFDQRKANAGWGVGLLADLSRAAPFSLAAMAGGLAGGPVGAGTVAGALVYGMSLEQYAQDPQAKDPARNRQAALMSAVLQAPLEAVAVGGILRAFRPASSWGKAVKAWGMGGIKEGVTEYAQSYPETLALEYARGLDPLEMKDMKKLLGIFASADFQKDALYQGAVGATLGGVMGAPGLYMNKKAYARQAADMTASLNMARSYPESYGQILQAHVQAGNVQEQMFVPAAAIEGLFQENATAPAASIAQDRTDFLHLAGVDRADFDAALASGGDMALPFASLHKVLNSETGGALRDQLKMSPEQEAVFAASGQQTQAVEDMLTASAEEEEALRTLMQEHAVGPELEERLAYRQRVADGILAASAGIQGAGKPYTKGQAEAYAAILDARALTWGQTFGQSPVQWYRQFAPEFLGPDATQADVDTARARLLEAKNGEFGTVDNGWLGNVGGAAALQQAAPASEAENVQRGADSMNRVITEQTDMLDAMFRPEVGSISFYWGTPGEGPKLKKGSGISHLIARRNADGQDGEAIARKMVDVIAKGSITKEQKAPQGDRVFISYDGHTAVLSLYRFRNRETWLLTGWKEEAPGAQSEVYDSEGATSDRPTRFRPAEVAGAFDDTIPPLGSDGNPLFQEIEGSARASVVFVEDAKALIRFFHAADISSAGHEIAHILRREMELSAQRPDAPAELKEDWQKVLAEVNLNDGESWGRRHEEEFADAFTNWLDTGEAPNRALSRVFRKLRQWLTTLYKRIARVGVEPSPAMREVFERLLATENQIAEARAKAAVSALATADALPAARRESYAAALAAAEEGTASAVEGKMLRELKSRQRAWAKEAKQWAKDDPDQQRLDHIIKEGGLRISEAEAEQHGQEVLTALRKKRVGKKLVVTEGGVDPAILADQWGFAGADPVGSLLAYLAGVPTKGALAHQYVAEATVQWEQSWQAEELVLTDELAHLLEVESGIMAEAVGKTAVDGAALRRAVARNVALLEMGKLEGQVAALKETMRQRSDDAREKFAARLEKRENETIAIFERRLGLMRDGMQQQALDAKEKQRRAMEELRERYRVRELRDKLFRKIRKAASAKPDVMDFAFSEQIRALAQRFGMGGKSLAPRDPKNMPSLTQFVSGIQADFSTDVPVPQWLLEMSAREEVSWKKLPVQKFEELADAILWLEHQGRTRKFWEVAGRKIDMERAVKNMVDSQHSLKSKKAIADYERKTLFKGALHVGRELLAEVTGLEWAFAAADGYRKGVTILDGAHDKYIVQPLYKARSDELAVFGQLKDTLDKILLPFRSSERTSKRWDLPEVPLPEKVRREWGPKPWTHEKTLMVALNMGNAGNVKALQKGFGWTREDLDAITASLTAEDWQMVVGIWKLVDSLYPALNATYQKINGIPMKKVEAQKLTTPYGVVPGGYFPLVFDQELSAKAAEQQEEDYFTNHQDALFMKPVPAQGFTKDRTGGTLPPRLSMSVLVQHLTQAVHYTTHAEAIRSIAALTKHQSFAASFEDKFGKPLYQQITPWLRHIARPEKHVLTRFEKVAELMRHMATIQGLGLKTTTAVMQLTSMPNSAQEIGWKALGEGLNFLARNRGAAYAAIRELSPMMRDRAKSIDRDLAANLNKYDPDRKALRFEWEGEVVEIGRQEVEEALFVPMQFADSITAYSTWWGAYQKALRETQGDQVKAVAFADRSVTRAQASGHAMNMTAMQRGHVLKKLMTMFMTFTMSLQNKMRFYFRGMREGKISPAQYMRHIFNDIVLPVTATTLLMGLLKRGAVPDDPKEYAKDIGFYMLSGYPFARDLGGFVEYGMEPGLVNSLTSRGIADPFKMGKRACELMFKEQRRGDEWEKFLKASLDAAGFWAGIPSRPVWQFIDGGRQLYEGKTSNPLRLFVKEDKPKK